MLVLQIHILNGWWRKIWLLIHLGTKGSARWKYCSMAQEILFFNIDRICKRCLCVAKRKFNFYAKFYKFDLLRESRLINTYSILLSLYEN